MTQSRTVTPEDVQAAVDEATELWQPNLRTDFAVMVADALFRRSTNGSDLADAVNSVAQGILTQDDPWAWCVYDAVNSAIYFPHPRTKQAAEAESARCGQGHIATPYWMASALSRAYNSGRASMRRKGGEDES